MEKFLYDKLKEKNPKLNVWFMYPAIESFALASLGFLSIFKMLDTDPELYVERIYSDTKIFEIPLDCLDCAGFSMSFEIDILTIIKMLKKYEIPLKSSDRDEETPLIFGGGPVLMANPLPFEEFFDFISVGEKNSLVTSGIYSVSRNPAFLAFDLMHIGILINFYNCLLLMLTVFSILIFHLQIVKVEEKYLINTFGEEYLCYCRKVNRYL